MGEWQTRALGELSTFAGGSAFPKEFQGNSTGEIPFIKVSDMSLPGNERLITRANNWISSATARDRRVRPVPAGSSVFAKIGEGLKSERIRIITRPTAIDNNMMAATATNLADPGFLTYLLSVIGLTSLAQGSALPYLRQQDLEKVVVRVPDFPEQRRIAGVLGAFDDLIDTNHGLVARMEGLLASVFEVEGFDSNSGDGVLGDVISVNPFYGKPSGVAPYVDMAALPTQGARVSAVGERTAAGGARFSAGDTLLARITPCLENGKTAFVDFLDTDEVGVGSTEFIVLRDQTGVSQHWSYFLARSERFRSYAIRHMTGTSGRQRCPAEAVARYPLAAPEREDLRRFERLAEPLFAAMRQLDAESAELTRTRDDLLPLLMSGRITVDEAWEAVP